jgi:hypothetical protein
MRNSVISLQNCIFDFAKKTGKCSDIWCDQNSVAEGLIWGMWLCVVGGISADIPKDYTAFTFMIKQNYSFWTAYLQRGSYYSL